MSNDQVLERPGLNPEPRTHATMSIIVNLDVVLAQRKMKLTELSERVGITMANLSILKQGKAKAVRFSTLEAICEALGCSPGDILEYQSEDKVKTI